MEDSLFMQKQIPVIASVTRFNLLRTLLLIAIIMIGVVILFHDYPGHDHLSFLHDFIQDNLMVMFLVLFSLLARSEIVASVEGMISAGLHPPASGLLQIKGFDVPVPHSINSKNHYRSSSLFFFNSKISFKKISIPPRHITSVQVGLAT
jgi:hypothetical protein